MHRAASLLSLSANGRTNMLRLIYCNAHTFSRTVRSKTSIVELDVRKIPKCDQSEPVDLQPIRNHLQLTRCISVPDLVHVPGPLALQSSYEDPLRRPRKSFKPTDGAESHSPPVEAASSSDTRMRMFMRERSQAESIQKTCVRTTPPLTVPPQSKPTPILSLHDCCRGLRISHRSANDDDDDEDDVCDVGKHCAVSKLSAFTIHVPTTGGRRMSMADR